MNKLQFLKSMWRKLPENKIPYGHICYIALWDSSKNFKDCSTVGWPEVWCGDNTWLETMNLKPFSHYMILPVPGQDCRSPKLQSLLKMWVSLEKRWPESGKNKRGCWLWNDDSKCLTPATGPCGSNIVRYINERGGQYGAITHWLPMIGPEDAV